MSHPVVPVPLCFESEQGTTPSGVDPYFVGEGEESWLHGFVQFDESWMKHAGRQTYHLHIMPRSARINSERLSASIEQALARIGSDQTALARKMGVSHAAVSDWIRMKKRPGPENLQRLLEALDLRMEDVQDEAADCGAGREVHGATSPTSAGSSRPSTPLPADPAMLEDLVLVPRIARGRAADLLRHGGYVNPSHGEIEGYDAFSRSEAQRLSGASPDDLYTVTVVGDSLLPEIPPGTRVAYVPRDRIDDYGLYVILVDDGVLVKRVQRYAGGAIEIIPINEAYSKEMLIPLADADTGGLYRSQQSGLTAEFRVIGKVVFYPKAA